MRVSFALPFKSPTLLSSSFVILEESGESHRPCCVTPAGRASGLSGVPGRSPAQRWAHGGRQFTYIRSEIRENPNTGTYRSGRRMGTAFPPKAGIIRRLHKRRMMLQSGAVVLDARLVLQGCKAPTFCAHGEWWRTHTVTSSPIRAPGADPARRSSRELSSWRCIKR
jgi:hypothetical protein